MEDEAAAASDAGLDLDAHTEVAGQGFFQILDVGGGAGDFRRLGGFGGALEDEALEVADGKVLGDGHFGEPLLLGHIGDGDEELGMAHGEAAVVDHISDWLGEVEQAQVMGDGAAVFAHAKGEFVLGEAELFHEGAVALGAFDGVEIFPLDVFDEGHLGLGVAIDIADDGGDVGVTGKLGGEPAAFAGDELVAPFHNSDDDGLDHARSFHAGSQFGDGGFLDGFAGLMGVGADDIDGDFERLAGGSAVGGRPAGVLWNGDFAFDGEIGDEAAEAATEPGF